MPDSHVIRTATTGAICFAAGCAMSATCLTGILLKTYPRQVPDGSETSAESVLLPGEKVESTIGGTRFTILAITNKTREFEWGACTVRVSLGEYGERWVHTGNFGLYYPGPRPEVATCGGIRRIVADEGRLYFSTPTECRNWIKSLVASHGGAVTLSHRGLIAATSFDHSREQWNVELWQLVIDGRIPERETLDCPEIADNLHVSFIRREEL